MSGSNTKYRQNCGLMLGFFGLFSCAQQINTHTERLLTRNNKKQKHQHRSYPHYWLSSPLKLLPYLLTQQH